MKLMLLTDGVRVSITAKHPCWLGIYWGTAIADMYPVIHRPWLEMRDVASLEALMANISLHHDHLHMFPFSVCLFFFAYVYTGGAVVMRLDFGVWLWHIVTEACWLLHSTQPSFENAQRYTYSLSLPLNVKNLKLCD